MTQEYDGRAIVATHSTLRWLIIIGIIVGAIGIGISWIFASFIGILMILFGFLLVALCSISLIFLWLTERILPKPK